ncbi:MAG: DNA topoisomerase [Rikenellaceae bacterium]
MITILAEKPSVARDIAAIVGATNKADGYLHGGGYAVTWAFGHLVQLAMPDEYGAVGYSRDHLPIIPDNFKLVVRQVREGKTYKSDSGAAKQLKVIGKLFEECDTIIVATDAGREGELIFRYIYDYLGCDKLFRRLWISSLTDSAIREGLNNLKEGAEYDNLYFAARSRSEADWLVGINASQALTLSAGGGAFSLGRVQTPTLKMICERYKVNKGFTPDTYYKIDVEFTNGITATSEKRYDNPDLAKQISDDIQHVVLVDEDVKEFSENPPLLYDLTTLQKEANKRYGYTAQETLDIIQGLYERKLITYPRTGSRYITEDMFGKLQELVAAVKSSDKWSFLAHDIDPTNLNRQCVDDSKVTDHHAIFINSESVGEMSEKEADIYMMIFIRILETVMPKCVKLNITIAFECNGEKYFAKSTEIKSYGWRIIQADGRETGILEKLHSSNGPVAWVVDSSTVCKKVTKPKSIHTESSLLSSMESAGRELTDDAERNAIKDMGIGTPATRAATIETLLARGYVIRDGKSLVPTPKGLAVYDAVNEMQISNVQLTGEWENGLLSIERGELDSATFDNISREYTHKITSEILSKEIETPEIHNLTCPKCGAQTVRIYDKVTRCTTSECGFALFREIASKKLTDKQIEELVAKGKTSTIKGFKSKVGKSFDAALRLDEGYKATFVFADNKGSRNKGYSKSK